MDRGGEEYAERAITRVQKWTTTILILSISSSIGAIAFKVLDVIGIIQWEVRTIPRKWTNSKGVNFDTERASARGINFLKKEVGIVSKKDNEKKPSYKKPYNKSK